MKRMGMRSAKAVLSFAVSTLAVAVAAADGAVTVESLLRDMTDADANTYFPEPAYTGRLWSSCDRGTTTADRPGWFANADFNNFVRSETADGRREDVMVDAEGPGAITRFWITMAGQAHTGDLRLVVDGRTVMETNCMAFVSGQVFAPVILVM